MTNRYLAIFHGDVGADRARELARASGFDVVENPALAPGHLLLTGSFRRLAELAARDELAYVMEASVNLVAGVPVMSCPGALSAIGAVGEYAQAGQGWSKDSSGAGGAEVCISDHHHESRRQHRARRNRARFP